MSHKAVKVEMPEEGSTLSFENFNRSMRVPFVVYVPKGREHVADEILRKL